MYQMMAQSFNENCGVEDPDGAFNDDALGQFEFFEEEVDELEEAFDDKDKEMVAEESADVIVTLFVLADRMGFNLREAYFRKMGYNLAKDGDMDENGKVIDDVDNPKPAFHDLYEEWRGV